MGQGVRTSYRSVGGEGAAEHVVEKSRFLGRIVPIDSEDAARLVLEEQRRQHWSARHHCYALVLGADGEVRRSNDDGEPSGTAGRTMLEVLLGAEISDAMVVVTRYFGGVLLGTGGLARAYAGAARLALDAAPQVDRVRHDLCSVAVDHVAVGRLQHELRSRGATVLGVEYDDVAHLRLAVAPQAYAVTEEIVAELTEGQATMSRVGERWIDQPVS